MKRKVKWISVVAVLLAGVLATGIYVVAVQRESGENAGNANVTEPLPADAIAEAWQNADSVEEYLAVLEPLSMEDQAALLRSEDTELQLQIVKAIHNPDKELRLATMLPEAVQDYCRERVCLWFLVDDLIDAADETTRERLIEERKRLSIVDGQYTLLERMPRMSMNIYGLLPEDMPRLTVDDVQAAVDAFKQEPDRYRRYDPQKYVCEYLNKIAPYDRSYGSGFWYVEYFLDETGSSYFLLGPGEIALIEDGVETYTWPLLSM